MPLPTKLTQLYEAALAEPDDNTLHTLWAKLAGLLDVVPDDVESRAKLATIWLDCSRMINEFNDDLAVTTSEVLAMGSLLSCPQSLERVVSDEVHAKCLAFIFATHVADYKTDAYVSGMDGIINVLSLWTGKDLVNDTKLGFEKTIELLYGPLVYPLYRPEVAEDSELPVHLYKENVPLLRELLHGKTQAAVDIVMPETLIKVEP